MSTAAPPSSPLAAAAAEAPRSGLPFTGLLRAEIRRLTLRRFILVLALAYAAGLVAVLVLQHVSHSPFDPATVQAQYETRLAQCERFSTGGNRQGEVPPDRAGPLPAPEVVEEEFPPEYSCRDELGADATEHAQRYGYDNRYRPVAQLPDGVLGTAISFASVAFLMGATFIGADWAAKTLPGLLTWEPRRTRVLLTKLLALLIVIAPLAALMQLLHLGGSLVTAQSHGIWDGLTPEFWPDLWAGMGRGVGLALMFAAAGFALAATLRYTAAAVGVAFAYVVSEMMLEWANGWWAQWKPSLNFLGWLQEGGYEHRFEVNRQAFEIAANPFRPIEPEIVTIHLTNARSGLYLLALCGVLLAVALASFRWRDIT